MILDEYIKITCDCRMKKYYNKLGYNVKPKQEFLIKVTDLPHGSNKKIRVKCDVCGKEKFVIYQTYLQSINNGGYYACSQKCGHKKVENTNIVKYGVRCPLSNNDIKRKSKNTLNQKYGVDNISKSNYFKKKYQQTMLVKYGVKNGFQSKEIKNKIIQTNLKKYGAVHPRKNEEFKKRFVYGQKSNFYIDGRSLNGINMCENNERNKWREKVFKKDKYICQCCGYNKGSILNAHHLDSWNWCKERRYEVTNGVTLCENCHKNLHSIYGYGNNTKEQFEEWILEQSQTTIETTSKEDKEVE